MNNQLPKNIHYVGINDENKKIFENHYPLSCGMSYNSYVIIDEKIAVFDSVDSTYITAWLNNISSIIGDRKPDYLIISHMEPDHSSGIIEFIKVYPDIILVASQMAFIMLDNFFHEQPFESKRKIVENNDYILLGEHTLNFIPAPMVHWPEVIMTYENSEKILFSADAFGRFGTNNTKNCDCNLTSHDSISEYRRYYAGIVGKYGPSVQDVITTVKDINIETICPLHGPILTSDINRFISYYDLWSKYEAESNGVLIVFSTVYGNTKKAVYHLYDELLSCGITDIRCCDLTSTDVSYSIANAYRYQNIILATTTYNGNIFPCMRNFVEELTSRNISNRNIGIIENGSWAPNVNNTIHSMMKSLHDINWFKNLVTIKSSLSSTNFQQIKELAKEIKDSMQ